MKSSAARLAEEAGGEVGGRAGRRAQQAACGGRCVGGRSLRVETEPKRWRVRQGGGRRGSTSGLLEDWRVRLSRGIGVTFVDGGFAAQSGPMGRRGGVAEAAGRLDGGDGVETEERGTGWTEGRE